MKTQYKEAKTTSQQILHLKEKKNIQFENIDEKVAKDFLLRYNYINVISPFKHYFAKHDDNDKNKLKKIDGRHIYEEVVDFDCYYRKYLEEREKYPAIAANILKFETQFKSIMSHCILTTKKMSDANDVRNFVSNELKLNNSKLTGSFVARQKRMNETLDTMLDKLENYADIYCFFDRQSLGTSLTMFTCLSRNLQDKIFRILKEHKLVFGVDKTSDFIDKTFTLVSIRNCVMHSNSLEILKRFYNPKTHELRKSSDSKKFGKLIKQLSSVEF